MSEMITIKGREVSEDTIALALMQYFTKHPEKKRFEKIRIDCIDIDADETSVRISTNHLYNGTCCYQDEELARRTIEAIEKAIDFIKSY